MVNSDEIVDLDPVMEDISSVWGKDPTAKNVDRYFGAAGNFRSGSLSPETLRINQSFYQLTQGYDENALLHHDLQVLQQSSKPVEDSLHAANRHSSHGEKGKSLVVEPVLSGGLEDIVNFISSAERAGEKGTGRLSALTRVSIGKESREPKGNGRRPPEASDFSSDFQRHLMQKPRAFR